MRPSPVYNVIGALSAPILYGLYRLRARGLENLPREGGFVLACTHVSGFAPGGIGAPLGRRGFLRFMGKRALYGGPLGPRRGPAGAFPVRREQKAAGAIAPAV